MDRPDADMRRSPPVQGDAPAIADGDGVSGPEPVASSRPFASGRNEAGLSPAVEGSRTSLRLRVARWFTGEAVAQLLDPTGEAAVQAAPPAPDSLRRRDRVRRRESPRRALSGPLAALDRFPLLQHLPFALVAFAYLWRFSTLPISVYGGYGEPPFDLAIFDQGVWLLSRFQDPFVTVMGRDLFGDHTSFILLLAVPLYWIWPHVQGLLVLQTVVLVLAAVPVYDLARRLLGSVALATAFGAVYLLNPALQWGNMEQFHPECFLALAMSLAVYAAVLWRPWLLCTAAVAALLVKEDAAVYVVALGVWVLFRRSRRAGLALVFGAGAYMAVAFEVIIPAILGVGSLYTTFIPFGGPAGVLETAVLHPRTMYDYLLAGNRPWYLWQMVSSVGLGFLLAPSVAAIGVLALLENYGSTLPYMQSIDYHYSLPIVPILVLGTVVAVAALPRRPARWVATGIVLASALAACVLWGLAPFSVNQYPYLSPSYPTNLAANRVIDALPPDAAVSAYYPWVAHVDHRRLVYMWPNPWQPYYYGNGTSQTGPLPQAAEVQYLLLPDPLSDFASDFEAIHRQFKLVTDVDGVALYHRVAPPPRRTAQKRAPGPTAPGRHSSSLPGDGAR
jgi:uncharacterized membrane protein